MNTARHHAGLVIKYRTDYGDLFHKLLLWLYCGPIHLCITFGHTGKVDLHNICLCTECQKLRNAAPLWKQLDLEQEEHLNDATVTAVKQSAARHVE